MPYSIKTLTTCSRWEGGMVYVVLRGEWRVFVPCFLLNMGVEVNGSLMDPTPSFPSCKS